MANLNPKGNCPVKPLLSATGSPVYPVFRLSSEEIGVLFVLSVMNKAKTLVRTLEATAFHPVVGADGSLLPLSLVTIDTKILILGEDGNPELGSVVAIAPKMTSRSRVYALGLASSSYYDSYIAGNKPIVENPITSVDDAERLIQYYEELLEDSTSSNSLSAEDEIKALNEDISKINAWRKAHKGLEPLKQLNLTEPRVVEPLMDYDFSEQALVLAKARENAMGLVRP